MLGHLRANLWLLVLTLLLCSVVYPLTVWAIGQAVFRDKAQGSLIDKDGKLVTDANKAVGSRLIAQPFTGKEYFQPRPSHAGGDSYDGTGYDAKASGASNWGANNPRLRARVARRLGPIVRYADDPDPKRSKLKKGDLAGPDIEVWFQENTFKGAKGIVALWAKNNPTLAQEWVKSDKSGDNYGPRGLEVKSWMEKNSEVVEKWVSDNPSTPEPNPEDIAGAFFEAYAAANKGAWPAVSENKIVAVRDGDEVQAYFFDMWLQEEDWKKSEAGKHGESYEPFKFKNVPADMVMASGSGLDPHITLDNALYQLDRVAAKRAEKTKQNPIQVRAEIEKMLQEKAAAPLGGLVGVRLVNVLDVNLALDAHFGEKPTSKGN